MDQGNNINKILNKLCKEIFPSDVFQKGNSRVYLDDNGYYFTMVEFQPYSLKKGTFLNVGISFLFKKDEILSFSYSYHDKCRVGKKFIEYKNDEQFEKDVRKYVELAKKYILKYRKFTDINYAKKYIVKKLYVCPYVKSMFYFLTDEQEKGRKYYKMFLEDPFYKNRIDEDHYPNDLSMMNKDYVMNMISNQRKNWHSKSSMKKMKIIPDYE